MKLLLIIYMFYFIQSLFIKSSLSKEIILDGEIYHISVCISKNCL